MKLSEFLTDLGRPVAYYPNLARALQDVKEAIFVCQMAYWKGKEQDPDGWIYKSSEEIESETALSYKEQLGVRAGLKAKKLMLDRYSRTEHKMYFRIDWDSVDALWEEYLTKGHMPKGKVVPDQLEDGITPKVISPSDDSAGGITPKVISLNRDSENTPEITPETTRDWEGISLSDSWQRVLDQVELEAPRASFNNYIRDTRAVRFDGNVLEIAATNADARDWLADRLTLSAENLLIGILNAEVKVVFVVAEEVSA